VKTNGHTRRFHKKENEVATLHHMFLMGEYRGAVRRHTRIGTEGEPIQRPSQIERSSGASQKEVLRRSQTNLYIKRGISKKKGHIDAGV